MGKSAEVCGFVAPRALLSSFSTFTFLHLNYWLVKSEPAAYSWADFARDGGTAWTGVRNFQARNYLQQMQPGDLVLFYHGVTDKTVVGVAAVVAPAAPDTTAPAASGWVAVALRPQEALAQPVSLATIKQDARLSQLGLLRQSRLSVMPLREAEFDAVLELGS